MAKVTGPARLHRRSPHSAHCKFVKTNPTIKPREAGQPGFVYGKLETAPASIPPFATAKRVHHTNLQNEPKPSPARRPGLTPILFSIMMLIGAVAPGGPRCEALVA
jgi:hypothetical protein